MIKYFNLKAFVFLCCCCLIESTLAQISEGGLPYSLTQKEVVARQNLSAEKIPPFNIKKVKEEDRKSNRSFRFAAPINVQYNLDNAGEWLELENGDRLWRLKVQSKGALGLFLLYDQFYLPKGAKLYMYSEDGSQVRGAYTYKNNKESGRFLTGMIKGETAMLEYYEPVAERGQGQIQIYNVMHAYEKEVMQNSDSEFRVYSSEAYGDALDCHVNVNCNAGADWQAEKKGVARIIVVVEEGMGYCSGSLINNTANDGKQYFLTANHCSAGFTPLYDMWRFDFNYETAGCANPTVEPTYDSVLGCTFKAARQESDFALYEIMTPIPLDYNVQLNGWNRSVSFVPPLCAYVHHPAGDIKKIAVENNSATIHPIQINWSNDVSTPGNHHFKINLDIGTIEGGSSGSPLFDSNGRIIGQLHGGNADCDIFITYAGRIAKSWDEGTTPETRLMDWLDPIGTGAITIDAFEPVETGYSQTGQIINTSGEGIGQVTLQISGGLTGTIVTDSSGMFTLNNLSPNQTYTITPIKNINANNGVSTFDIVTIQKHILGVDPIDAPYTLLAADANNSGTVTTFDLVELRKLVLTIYSEFPQNLSWRFVPESVDIHPAVMPVIIGYKIGDVTGDADPNN